MPIPTPAPALLPISAAPALCAPSLPGGRLSESEAVAEGANEGGVDADTAGGGGASPTGVAGDAAPERVEEGDAKAEREMEGEDEDETLRRGEAEAEGVARAERVEVGRFEGADSGVVPTVAVAAGAAV